MLDAIRFSTVRARFQALADCHLPKYKATMIRGALGNALQQLTCQKSFRCDGCLHSSQCAYGAIFEDVPGASQPTSDRTRPYIIKGLISEKESFRAADTFDVEITLVGNSRRWSNWFIAALHHSAFNGFGVQRSKWLVQNLSYATSNGSWQPLEADCLVNHLPEQIGRNVIEQLPLSDNLRLSFLTPTQLKKNSTANYHPTPELIVRRLLRRLGTLAQRFCGWHPEGFVFKPLVDKANQIRVIDRCLQKRNWERYASRTNENHPLEGFVGELTMAHVSTELLPYFAVGQKLHIGNGASFGMGYFVVEPLPPLVN